MIDGDHLRGGWFQIVPFAIFGLVGIMSLVSECRSFQIGGTIIGLMNGFSGLAVTLIAGGYLYLEYRWLSSSRRFTHGDK